MDETEISSERVIADLVENAEIAMGRKPSRRSVWRGGKLCQIEVFEHNGVAAVRALELLGKQLGMFKERCEFGVDARFSRMSNEELDAFIRAKLDSIKLIEGTCGPSGSGFGGREKAQQ
jgi:phage terminase small subunit